MYLLRALTLVALFGGLVTSAVSVDIEYLGDTIPIRKGESDTNDLVSPYARHSQPAAFEMGSTLSIKPVSESGDPELTGWKVLGATLRCNIDESVIWSVTEESSVLGMTTSYSLPSLPEHVEWATLELDVIFIAGSGGGGTCFSGPQSSVSYGEIFVLYDQPVAQMSTPWVGVLRYSCQWAHELDDSDDIAANLTIGLFTNGSYNYARSWFTSDDEVFHLRHFLEYAETNGIFGQCNDFADFLACLMTSQGVACEATRSYPYSVVYWGLYDPDSEGWGFETNVFLPANGTSHSTGFTYHQFTIRNNTVFDAALALGTGSPVVFALVDGWSLSTYKSTLIDHYRQWISDVEVSNPAGDPWSPASVSFSVSTTASPHFEDEL